MSCDLTINDEIREIIEKSPNPEKACAVTLWLGERCRKDGIPFADYGWKSLVNHLCAMVGRSVSGEVLDIDAELFDEVAEDSLQLSQEVVDRIGGIAAEEKYLLSIHFESAKENAD